MERERSAEQLLLDEIVESLPDAFTVIDSEFRIVTMNALAEQYGGIERSSVIGLHYWSAFPGLVGTPFADTIHRAMRERVVASVETFYPVKHRWFLLQARPIPGGGLALFGRDTTDRHQAEEANRLLMRERDQLLARLQEQFQRMPLACIVADPQLLIIDWNPAAEQVFGFRRDEVVGRNALPLLVPPVARPKVEEVVERALRGELIDYVVAENVTKQGNVIGCAWHNTALRDHDGRLIAFLSMVEDVTARRDAERQLRESQSMLAEAQRIAQLGSWSWDLATNQVTWSDEMFRLVGLPPNGSASPKTVGNFIHPEDRESVAARLAAVQQDRRPIDLSWRAVRVDGEIRFMHSTVQVEVDDADKPMRLFGTMQDVTEQEQLLANERRARAEAEHAARLKDEFLATLSHELRTPLSAITSWADVLRTTPADAARVERGLEVIARNARTQAQLVGDLLDLSRIVTGKLRLEVQRVVIADIVTAVVDAMMPAATARGIELDVVIESITDAIHGDPSRLQQVVWNLIANAVKFSPEHGHVEVVVARVGLHIEISISDNGKGIDPAFLPHVFGRFRQADASAAREHGGLGIGLALVKELVELHGGTVSAHSAGAGQGARFVVKLPVAMVTEQNGEVRVHPRVPAALSVLDVTMPHLNGVRVLVVEDDPDGLEVIRQLLTDQEAVVTAVRSVDDALGALDRQSFDVLLSDIGMPRRDGYELICEVRKRGLKLPAAAVTAFARSEDRTRALLSGFQAHLAKPLEVSELVATVASLSGRLSY